MAEGFNGASTGRPRRSGSGPVPAASWRPASSLHLGRWVTGGTAEEMVSDARENGRAELAAVVCVDRFLDEAGAVANLAELKEQSQWQRDDYIEDGGWTTLIGFDSRSWARRISAPRSSPRWKRR